MFGQNKLFIYVMYTCIISLFAVNIIIIHNSSNKTSQALSKQQEQTYNSSNNNAIQDDIEVYTYKITSINDQGYIGKSLDNNTGIFFTNDNIDPGMKINKNDIIKAAFPAGDYETILNIEKVK